MNLYEERNQIVGSEFSLKLTVKQAKENSVNVIKLTRQKDEAYVVGLVTKMLNDTMMFIKSDLNLDQLSVMARAFITANPTLTIDEITYILTKGTKGHFGIQYGDFTYLTLMDWMAHYEKNESSDYMEQKNQKSTFGETERVSKQGESLGDVLKNRINVNKK